MVRLLHSPAPNASTVMKWVTILSFAIVLSLAESRILQKRDRHEGDHGHEPKVLLVGDACKLLGKEGFESIAMVLFSQKLQKCPFEEQVQRVKEVSQIGEKCSTGIKTAQCGKSVTTVIMDEICKSPENPDKYPSHKVCCAKADPERHRCFTEHKLTAPDALPPYQKPDPVQVCNDYKENKVSFLGHYIYEVARRHPQMYAPSVIYVAIKFAHITADCCKDTATCTKCFLEKLPDHVREMKLLNSIQQHSCYALKSFNERVLQSIKLVQMAQKFPKASYELIIDIVRDIVHLTKTCCTGDMIACMTERLALTTKTCEKKDELSSKLKDCCEKGPIERSTCIVEMDNDDKPADLSPQVREYIEDVSVCQKYENDRAAFVGKFLYDYARRHPEMSVQMHLKIATGIQALLNKCCKEEDKLACLGQGEGIMQKQVHASVELLKMTCGALEKLGPYLFQNQLLVRYTPKMPQMTTSALIQMTSSMTHVGEYCCKVPAEKQLPCSEEGLSLIIGDMCQKQKDHFVNQQVSHCCSDSYAAQRSCFTDMERDRDYVPPAPSVDHFKFNDKLCTVEDPKALEVSKQMLLVNLIKLEPTIKDEQRNTITEHFLAMVEQCCKADNHSECFAAEGPKLITKCQELLGLPAVAV